MTEMLTAEIWSIAQTSHGNAILLRPQNLDIAVPIFIGQLEMQSILIGREGVTLPRPLTHDLLLNLFSRLDLTLKRVEIYELRDNTFYARIVITGGTFSGENPLILDARPSDAIALAVRRRFPIYIAAAVVEQAGIPLDFFVNAMEETGIDGVPEAGLIEAEEAETNKHQTLLEQLNRALAAEEYEQAAEIRDLLKLMEKDGNSDI
jgi:bifunctional DNase/RNase